MLFDADIHFNDLKFLYLNVLGLVAQSIVSLTPSLRRQLVKYMQTTLSNMFYFLFEKNVEIFCSAKDSHIVSTKNNSGFEVFTFETLTKR